MILAAEEDAEPALKDHWQDVCAAFHDADAHELYVKPERILDALETRAKIRLSALDAGQPLEFRAQAADISARSLAGAEPELEKLTRSQYVTVIAWANKGTGERAAYNLGRLKAQWGADAPSDLRFVEARLRDGFIAPQFQLAVIPEHRLIHHRRQKQERPGGGNGRGALRSFADLRTGDIVVHEDHGLARFAGFDTKTVAGVTRDYLNLEYAGTDKVFLPVDQLAKISRYVGAGGAHPPLSKLGGTRWETIKSRARRAAQELAGELLNLYAERRRRRGHSFGEDPEELLELETAFPYRETPDQKEAIENVKADMESERPMDRLICGDVGYGKTEVALRAAVKAMGEGKQVLMLVPTTILAQQHYGTFIERLRDTAFVVEHVSRFRPAAEQRDAIKRFSEGKVDCLIGTHRIFSRDVRAKDLGLLIVDEEQRFGVKQKELLRQMKLKVDVIAMSAASINFSGVCSWKTCPTRRLRRNVHVERFTRQLLLVVLIGAGLIAYSSLRPRPSQPDTALAMTEAPAEPVDELSAAIVTEPPVQPREKSYVVPKRPNASPTPASPPVAPALPADSLPSQQLIERLAQFNPNQSAITPEQATALRQNFQDLLGQGAAAVPAIKQFLEKNQDLTFDEAGSENQVGHSSLRAGLFETLEQIGGPEATEAFVSTLRNTADPSEIAMMARFLEEQAPGQYRQEVVAAKRETLDQAVGGHVQLREVGTAVSE